MGLLPLEPGPEEGGCLGQVGQTPHPQAGPEGQGPASSRLEEERMCRGASGTRGLEGGQGLRRLPRESGKPTPGEGQTHRPRRGAPGRLRGPYAPRSFLTM